MSVSTDISKNWRSLKQKLISGRIRRLQTRDPAPAGGGRRRQPADGGDDQPEEDRGKAVGRSSGIFTGLLVH